jgi:trans-aconitate methyltransferase
MKTTSTTILDFAALEEAARQRRLPEAIRALSIPQLGSLMLATPESPLLRAALPSMPPDEIQRAWTGNSGAALMAQTIEFIEQLQDGFATLTSQTLTDKRFLDYGCGWGRHLRFMLKFSPAENIFGCDAWDESIRLCRDHNVRGTIITCDYVPKAPPFGEARFDLIYAYSVFTHLSESTCKAVLDAFRQCIQPTGLVAITVRPEAYWDRHDQKQNAVDVGRMKRSHREHGFAFEPHLRPPIEGEVRYGDTSISIDYMHRTWLAWQVVSTRMLSDQNQAVIFLKPR